MALVAVYFGSVQGSGPRKGKRLLESYIPMTFRDAFPNAKGMPSDLLASDYSYEWKPDGTLRIIETLFVLAEHRGLDIYVSREPVRKLESEEVVQEYCPSLMPEVDAGDGRGYLTFTG